MYEQSYHPYIKNISVVKEYFKTPCVLISGCARALSCVLALIAAVLTSMNADKIMAYLREYFVYLFDQFYAPADVRSKVLSAFDQLSPSAASSAGITGSIPSAVVTALIAAAFLIIFFKSRSAEPGATPITGFTILYVFAIIELIFSILALLAIVALIVLLFLFYTAYAKDMHDSAFFSGIISELVRQFPLLSDIPGEAFLVAAIAMIVALVFVAFYVLFTIINKLRYYKSVRRSLSSVELHSEGAKPYGVMCVISAVFSAGSLLSMPSILFVGTLNGKSNPLIAITIVNMLAQAAALVATIMEAKLALGYKTYIDGVKYGYHTPAAPAAPYSPLAGVAAQQNQQPRTYRYTDFAPTPAATPENEAQPKPETDNAYADPYGADPEEAPADKAPVDADREPEAVPAPVCPVCGSEVDPSAPFCGNCGNRL